MSDHRSPPHYGRLNPQPWDVWHDWNLHPDLAAVLAYLARWRHKNGADDLRKACNHLYHFMQAKEGKTRGGYSVSDVSTAWGFSAHGDEAEILQAIYALAGPPHSRDYAIAMGAYSRLFCLAEWAEANTQPSKPCGNPPPGGPPKKDWVDDLRPLDVITDTHEWARPRHVVVLARTNYGEFLCVSRNDEAYNLTEKDVRGNYRLLHKHKDTK